MTKKEDLIKNNFIMYVDNDKGIEDRHWKSLPENQYLEDELMVNMSFFMPNKQNENIIYEVGFVYIFEFYHTRNGDIEIVFNDVNRPNVSILMYDLDEFDVTHFDLEEKQKIYAKSKIDEKMFVNFFVENFDKYFKNKFLNIDEQFFFNFKINKEKVYLNKDLLEDLKANFQREVIFLTERISEKDSDSILRSNPGLSKRVVNGFIENIKGLEAVFNYEKLTKELKNEQSVSVKKNKSKI